MLNDATFYRITKQTKRIVLANAFSVNMLENDCSVRFKKVELEDVKKFVVYAVKHNIEIKSAIVHESIAKVLSELLNYNVLVSREAYKMQKYDLLIIFQLKERLVKLEKEELKRMIDERKVEFWLAWIEKF